MREQVSTNFMKMIVLLVLFAIPLALPDGAFADDSGLEAAKKKFAGVYVGKHSVKTDQKAIHKAIEKLVEEMSFYKRPFARSALKDSTEPCPKLELSFSGDDMTIHCKTGAKTTSPVDGTKVRWDNSEGDPHRLSQKLEKTRIVQVFRGEDGARKNVYTLQKGGKELEMEVTITSDELPRPLTYTRILRRK